MILKSSLIISGITITASALALLAYLSFASNVYTDAMGECKKEPLECRLHCFGAQLSFVDTNGTIIPEKAPFGHLITNFTLLDECEEAENSTEKCGRTAAQIDCIIIGIYEAAENASATCAEETSVDDLLLTKDEIVASFKDPKRACYNLCMLRRFHAVDVDGNLRVETIFRNVRLFKPEDLRGAVEDCANQNTDDELCQRASKRALCVGTKLLYKIGLAQLLQMSYLFV